MTECAKVNKWVSSWVIAFPTLYTSGWNEGTTEEGDNKTMQGDMPKVTIRSVAVLNNGRTPWGSGFILVEFCGTLLLYKKLKMRHYVLDSRQVW